MVASSHFFRTAYHPQTEEQVVRTQEGVRGTQVDNNRGKINNVVINTDNELLMMINLCSSNPSDRVLIFQAQTFNYTYNEPHIVLALTSAVIP